MTAHSPAEAADQFVAALQRAVTCLSRAVIVQGRAAPGDPIKLAFAERLIPLQGRHRLDLSFLHTFRFRENRNAPRSWTVQSASYSYQIHERDGPEIIAFHWHPGHSGAVPFAHLHISGQGDSVRIDRKRHVPTGRISLEAVVRFAIEELHVRPLRPDWQGVLEDGIARFDTQRSW